MIPYYFLPYIDKIFMTYSILKRVESFDANNKKKTCWLKIETLYYILFQLKKSKMSNGAFLCEVNLYYHYSLLILFNTLLHLMTTLLYMHDKYI